MLGNALSGVSFTKIFRGFDTFVPPPPPHQFFKACYGPEECVLILTMSARWEGRGGYPRTIIDIQKRDSVRYEPQAYEPWCRVICTFKN